MARKAKPEGLHGEELWAAMEIAGFYGARLKMFVLGARDPWVFVLDTVRDVQATNEAISRSLGVDVPVAPEGLDSLAVGDWASLLEIAAGLQVVNGELRQKVKDAKC